MRSAPAGPPGRQAVAWLPRVAPPPVAPPKKAATPALPQVPAALAQLSTLQHLDVSRNSIYLGPDIELLCAMPALCRLVLGRQSSPITQEAKGVVEQLHAMGLEVI